MKRLAAAALPLASGNALAHGGEVWQAWTLDPWVLVPLALAGYLYARGSVRPREARWFAGGMAALLLALVWPLDVLGEERFSMHMAQHLVLMNLAAPLLVLGAPLGAMLRALPRGWSSPLARLAAGRRWRSAWHWSCGLAVVTVAQQVVLWVWHTPAGIAAALESDAVHIAMHGSLLAAALLFWTAVLRPRSARYWAPIVALLITLKISGVVCIMLLVQPAGIYDAYGADADDEYLGWGLMMIAGSVTYLGAAVALAAAWFHSLERSDPST